MRGDLVRRLDEDRMFQRGQDHEFRPRHRRVDKLVEPGIAGTVILASDDLRWRLHLVQPGPISVAA